MAFREHTRKIVVGLQPQQDGTLVNFGPLDGNPNPAQPSVMLKNDHPAYSAIFALLMASGVNQKPLLKIGVEMNSPVYMTLVWVCMWFE